MLYLHWEEVTVAYFFFIFYEIKWISCTNRPGSVSWEGLLCLLGSEAVGQLFCEPERFGFIHRARQVPHTSSPPLLQHQPARVLPSRLLLCSLLCSLPLQPAGQRKKTVAIKSELSSNLMIKSRCAAWSVTEAFVSVTWTFSGMSDGLQMKNIINSWLSRSVDSCMINKL